MKDRLNEAFLEINKLNTIKETQEKKIEDLKNEFNDILLEKKKFGEENKK